MTLVLEVCKARTGRSVDICKMSPHCGQVKLGQGARSGRLTHSFAWYAWNTVMVHNKAILAMFSKSDFLTLIPKTLSVLWMLSLH